MLSSKLLYSAMLSSVMMSSVIFSIMLLFSKMFSNVISSDILLSSKVLSSGMLSRILVSIIILKVEKDEEYNLVENIILFSKLLSIILLSSIPSPVPSIAMSKHPTISVRLSAPLKLYQVGAGSVSLKIGIGSWEAVGISFQGRVGSRDIISCVGISLLWGCLMLECLVRDFT